MRLLLIILAGLFIIAPARAQKRLVLIDEDGSGPGGTNQMAMMALLQAPQAEVLGITIVTGDAWRDEEVQHTLRMLELLGRREVPLARGAAFPLVRSQEETRLAAQLIGKADWLGAWGDGGHGASDVPPLPEGPPQIKPIEEDAAHFLVRTVRAHPHQVTIFAGGPLTNIALAISLDAEFAELTQGIALMGGSLNPQTNDPEFAASPRHEFNFWFDPEAAHIVLRAHWPRIDVTTVDVSIQAPFTESMLQSVAGSARPAAQYIAKYSPAQSYLWDELAACSWLDRSLITKERILYMDVDLSHGPSYGNTLTWDEKSKPATGVQLVHAQVEADVAKFAKMFVGLMTGK